MGLRRVVVMSAGGKEYLGSIDLDADGGSQLRRLEEMRPVKLLKVYELRLIDQEIIDPAKRTFVGLSRSYMLLNIGGAKGALPELNLMPEGWYDSETCDLLETHNMLVVQADKLNSTRDRRVTDQVIPVGAGALDALGKAPSLRELIDRDKR